MNEQGDNATYEFLGKLLANPADPDRSYTYDLRSLVARFPQSGLLHALLVANGDNDHLKHAAAYVDPQILYKLTNAPGSLPVVAAEQIAYVSGSKTAESITYNLPVTEPFVPPVPEPEAVYAETTEDITDEVAAEEPVNTFAEEEIADEQATVGADAYFHQEIDDEVYDEIVGIEDIGLEQPAAPEKVAEEEEKTEEPAVEAESNYFVFDQEATHNVNEDDPAPAIATEQHFVFDAGGTEHIQEADNENSNISRYNDDKMPYTFMWWLDKTRKEHEYIYQPYISNKTATRARQKKREVVDELQQQYFQNIVSTASINELDQIQKDEQPDQPVKKEQQIIERFIKEEPQIKHPSGVKLDNENKAKRSSEDKEELVTETLARIYTEQMLYRKAILTYKKLMLKFPEKSLYFAGQIEQLESKIN